MKERSNVAKKREVRVALFISGVFQSRCECSAVQCSSTSLSHNIMLCSVFFLSMKRSLNSQEDAESEVQPRMTCRHILSITVILLCGQVVLGYILLFSSPVKFCRLLLFHITLNYMCAVLHALVHLHLHVHVLPTPSY
ncbi:hypothetical protein RJT34_32847 [Clitoria ternatea]|uniref:Uncharacterized protein n=1 Tax=Clitoria ternatea TaxID=43366 RepID=A0AAN9EZ30_CLITE